MKVGIALLVAGSVAAFAFTAAAKDKELQKKDLPAAVAAAMDAESKGDTVKGYKIEIEDGKMAETDATKVIYELQTLRAGKTRDLLFDATGKIVNVETEIELGALPAAVRAEAQKAAGKNGKITAETVVLNGTSVDHFEIHIENGPSKTSLEVAPDGKVLKTKEKKAHGEEGEKDEDDEDEEKEDHEGGKK